jgi:hypothetical protein
MNNPTPIVRARTPHARPQRQLGCWQRFLTAGLALGLAAVLQTARADTTIYLNDFNNATNNIANNDLGTGGGFTAFSYNNGVNLYFPSAFETNTWNGLSGGFAVLADSTIGDLYSSLDTVNPFNLNGGGTTFELSGVSFSTNTPIPNGGGGASGNVDRLIWGVTTIAPAGAWLSAGVPGAIPTGFWIQFNSDSLYTGTGVGSWSGTSTLFYKDTGTNVYQLCNWKFDNLYWTNGVYQFSQTLDVKLTLSGTGWALNITGDTATNLPISYSGTYAAGGVMAGTTTPAAINPLLFNGINKSYLGGFNQTANPGIAMQIDQVKVTQLGTLVVTTPQFLTPAYGFNTNAIRTGEAVALTSIVTDSAGTPSLQWQLADLSSGIYNNLPSGTATNVNVDTSSLLGNYGIRLIATDGGLSVTSAVVALTVATPSAPVVVQDPTPAVLNLYRGQGGTFDATFTGNLPMSIQWQISYDSGSSYTPIPGATNTSYTVQSASDSSVAFYSVSATNSVPPYFTTSAADGYVQLIDGTPQYLWSAPYRFGGQTADQILTNFPATSKIVGAMYATNGGLPLVVTTSAGDITFGPNGLGTIGVSGFSGYSTGANANDTGNANFNTCLNDFVFDGGATHLISISNLVVGQTYQVQLFGLDDRSASRSRVANWADPLNPQDVSVSYKMGDHAYFLGTFVASNTVQTIQQNLLNNTNGNFNCLILRTVGWTPPPYFALQPQNKNYFTQTNAVLLGVAGGDSSQGAITYQWKSGPVGGPYAPLADNDKYAGTTTTTLTISNLVTADGGPVYVLTAHNSGGDQDSRETVLLIQPIPPAPDAGSFGAAALANNPVALWMLDETNNPISGTVKGWDYTGNQHLLTYGIAAQNGFNGIQAPQPPTYPGFYTGEAATRTLANNQNSILRIPVLNNTNLATTVAMWINPASGETGNYAHGLIGGRNNTVAGQVWQLGYSAGTGNLGYNWNDVSGTYTYNTGLAPVQATWNFVAMVITSNNATFYLYYLNSSGQPVLRKAVNAVANTTPITMAGGTTVIGSDPYDLNGRSFNGSISGVALYNTALTESQLQTMFGTGVGIAGAFPPGFATQPATTAGFTNSTLQFSATTSGTAPITNQWVFTSNSVPINLVDGNFSGTIITGSKSNVLTIANPSASWQGAYNLILSNAVGSAVGSNAFLYVFETPSTKTLVGQWLPGTQSLAEVSGYRPPGTHDAFVQSGSTVWDSDVPASAPPGSYSLAFTGAGLQVSNSATVDAGYVSTFDGTINNGMTVMCWAKGWPGQWNPWVSKYGDNSIGWQLRRDSTTNYACWTTRNASGGGDSIASHFSNDGQWHHYAGTYDRATGIKYLYVDGVLVARQTGVGAINLAIGASASHVMIGARDQAGTIGNQLTGKVYDVRIYNYALPQYQVASVGKGLGLNVARNVYYTPGANATFTTPGIAAEPPYTGYQWQFNSANLADGAYLGATITGSQSTNLTVTGMTANNAGLYQLLVTNGAGVTTNSIVNLTVTPTNLVGRWLAGSQTMTDLSGYAPAGTHDAGLVATNGVLVGLAGWSTDVPASAPGGSYSLGFTNAGLIVSNTAATDAAYVNTFDDKINNGMTVMCWAKGFPGAWNPWVSKFGEALAWQLRINNTGPNAAWSIRGTGGTEDMTSSFGSNDGNWHHYAGTYSPVTGVRTLYVDGKQAVTQSGQGPYTMSSFSHLMIGARDNGGNTFDNRVTGFGNYFTGKIYDVRVYNYPLSQFELGNVVPGLTPTLSQRFLRGAGGTPGKFVVSWSAGTLLTATNAAGPWETNAVQIPPLTNDMTLPADFFKVRQ